MTPTPRILTHGDTGNDVLVVQDAANRRLERHGLGRYRCAVDGEVGPQTLLACEKAAWALGVHLDTLQRARQLHVITVGVQHVISEPDKYRRASNLEIAKARAKELVTREHSTAVSPCHITGNHVLGGSPEQRLEAAAVHAMYLWETGKEHRYYSMSGRWDVDHAITGPAPGARDDCSSWFIGIHKAAGLPDPAGTDYRYGNTETLWNHGTEIRESELRPSCGVIYGRSAAASHHIEFYWKGSTTIGHGDAAVNRGTVHEMGDAHFFKFL